MRSVARSHARLAIRPLDGRLIIDLAALSRAHGEPTNLSSEAIDFFWRVRLTTPVQTLLFAWESFTLAVGFLYTFAWLFAVPQLVGLYR